MLKKKVIYRSSLRLIETENVGETMSGYHAMSATFPTVLIETENVGKQYLQAGHHAMSAIFPTVSNPREKIFPYGFLRKPQGTFSFPTFFSHGIVPYESH